jgi:hypothetical protein
MCFPRIDRRLYSTDVVTWHKDNSVTIDSYPTVTTAAFARCLLPAGLRLGADMMMSFDAKIIHVENERWGNYIYASHQRTCCADGTYRQHGDTWLPDEDTIQPISVVTLDTKLTRAAAKEHNLAGFTTWLFTMGHHEVEIEHAGTDYEACVEALKAREFRKAASHLPPFSGSLASFGLRYRIKPLPFRNVRWGEPITMGSIDYVRRYIYEQAGAYTISKVPHMSLSGYEKQKALRRKLNAVGIYP